MHVSAFQAAAAIWLGVCIPAVIWGGRPERIVGLTLLAALVVALVFYGATRNNNVQWWSLAVDSGVFVVMLATLRHHPRRWLMMATGFEFVALLVHVPRILDRTIHEWAYAAANNYAGFAVVIALLVGTVANLGRGGQADAATARR